jgi:hypothetical protein
MLFRSLLLCCIALFAVPAHAERLSVDLEPGFIQTYRALAVKILRGDAGDTQFIGTGFAWVQSGRVLTVTNFHVAQKGLQASSGTVGLQVGFAAPVNWHAATRVLGVPGADLAIIETDVVAPQARPYQLGVAELNEEVYSISYDQGDFQQASPVVYKGRVMGIVGALFPSSELLIKPPVPPDAVRVYVVDGSDCVPGASGSMMLNSRGQVFAYNAGRIDNGYCIAVGIEEVLRALAR